MERWGQTDSVEEQHLIEELEVDMEEEWGNVVMVEAAAVCGWGGAVAPFHQFRIPQPLPFH